MDQFDASQNTPQVPGQNQPLVPDQQGSWLNQMPAGGPVLAPPHSSFGKKILIIGSVVLVAVVGLVGYFILRANNGNGLEISIGLPDQLHRGVPTELIVQIANNSGDALKDAQVSVTLPEDIIFVGVPGSRTVENRSVGVLESAIVRKESFMIMATGQENTVLQVKAAVSYVPGALSSRFEKIASKDVVVGAAGIDLSITAPTKVLGSSEFVTEINYHNATDLDYEAVKLAMKYPQGFTVTSADPQVSAEDAQSWNIAALAAGASGKLVLKGFIVGQDEAIFEIGSVLSAQIGEGRYDLAQTSVSLTLAPSPLSIRIELEGGNNKVVAPAESLRYRLTYTNTTEIGLKDVIVRAKTTGEMFDIKTLKTNGVLRSSDNTIVWNASRVPELSSLAPGATGAVTFTITTKPAYPITRLSSKNFVITVNAEIESPTVPRGVSLSKTLGLAQLTSKMKGMLGFISSGYYRDAASGFANDGVFPAIVGRATQFTIHWIFKNTSTDVENISLKAFLGSNVRYTGKYKSTTPDAPVYNDRTQEMTWGVAKIPATKGILSDPTELIFQVELTPAIDQVDQYPELIRETTGTYTDSFTGEKLNLQDGPVTVMLPDDLTVTSVDKRVKSQ